MQWPQNMTESWRENLMKELERERMLRVDAEQRLRDMTVESDTCKERLQSLQQEFIKMEETVRNMMEYKSKIDQLKQEKSSLLLTYENNLQKYRAHIGNLERENMVLLNGVKKLESQVNSKTDERDKSKLLLERLKMLEAENSGLVLENEQQRQQYEKCLDEIANQVVQALLAQKTLREECMKLQGRVCDLELQNRQLNQMFQHRMRFPSDSVLQHSGCTQHPQILHPSGSNPVIGQPNISDTWCQTSMESLQSMCSEYMYDDCPSGPQMSPPPANFSGNESSRCRNRPGTTKSGHTTVNTSTDSLQIAQKELSCRTKIETEFPATNTSPKVKHVSVYEKESPTSTRRSSSTSSLSSANKQSKIRTRSTSSLVKSPLRCRETSSSSTEHQSSPSPLPSPSSSEKPPLSRPQTPRSPLRKIPVPKTASHHNSSSSIHSTQSGSRACTPVASKSTNQNTAKTANQNSNKTVSSKQVVPGNHATKIPSHGPNLQSYKIINPANSSPGPNMKITNQNSTTQNSKISNITVQNQRGQTASGQNIKLSSQNSVAGVTNQNTMTQNTKSANQYSGVPSVTNQNTMTQNTKSANQYSGVPSVANSSTKTSTSVLCVGSQNNVGQSSKIPSQGSVTASVKNSTPQMVHKNYNQVSNVGQKNSKSQQSSIPVTGKVPVSSSKLHSKSANNTSNIPPPSPKLATSNMKKEVPSKEIPRKSVPATLLLPQPKQTNTPQEQKLKKFTPSSKNGSYPKGGNVSNFQPLRCPSIVAKGQYFYDYSDEDSDATRTSSFTHEFSTASTLSLNELLEDHLDCLDTPVDDFSPEKYPLLSPAPFLKINKARQELNSTYPKMVPVKQGQCKEQVSAMKTSTENGRQIKPLQQGGISENSDTKCLFTTNMLKKRPNSLILAPRNKNFLYHGYSSSESESSDSDDADSASHSIRAVKNSSMHNPSQGRKKVNEGSTCSQMQHKVNVAEKDFDRRFQTFPGPQGRKGQPPPVPRKPVLTPKSSSNSTSLGSSPEDKEVNKTLNSNFIVQVHQATMQMSPNFKLRDDPFLGKRILSSLKSENEDCTRDHNGDKDMLKFRQIFKSSDSGFDSFRVEQSSSKDDGYSTMSSDIQPEVLEKFSDSNSKRLELTQPVISDHNSSMAKRDCFQNKGFFEMSSDQDSAMESSTHSNDIRNSNQSLSSQTSVSSDEKSVVHGSLGRVRAMRMLFESDSQRTSETGNTFCKDKSPVRSFIKKSNSFEYKVPVKPDSNSLSPKTLSDGQVFFHNNSIDSNSSSSAPDKSTDLMSLHISEDILSDIPEERDEWDNMSARSSDKQSGNISNITHHSSNNNNNNNNNTKQLTKHPVKFSLEMKKFWTSTQGLSRALSESDLVERDQSVSSALDDLFSGHFNMGKPLEHSVSISDLRNYKKLDAPRKLSPGLNRSPLQSLIDELSVQRQVQTIVQHYFAQKSIPRKQHNHECLDKSNAKPEDVPRSSSTDQSHGSYTCFYSNEHFSGANTTSLSNSYLTHSSTDSFLSQDSSHLKNSLNSHQNGSNEGPICLRHLEQNLDKYESFDESDNSSILPMEDDQKKFRSEFYSLCQVGSNRSLCSGGIDSEFENMASENFTVPPSRKSETEHSSKLDKSREEFDEISKQIETLSKTVNELHQSLSSLNSGESETESNEGDHAHTNGNSNGQYKDTDGYHWVDDEFFLTPCGGEIILGSSPFSETGAACEWMNEYMDNNAVPLEFNEDFHDSQWRKNRQLRLQPRRANCSSNHPDSVQTCANSNSTPTDNLPLSEGPRGRLNKEQRICSPEKDIDDSLVEDPQSRGMLLDMMLDCKTASQDSLDDDIGVDKMMCERFISRERAANRQEAIRLPSKRPAVNFRDFFIRYEDPEKEAVAAFDFLNDIPISPTDSTSKQAKGADQMDQSNQSLHHNQQNVCREFQYSGFKHRRRGKKTKPSSESKIKFKKMPRKSESVSSSSPESPEDSDLSFSDSCCESYSSSNPSINDITVL
ncbi:hypothetical protein ScPMuIL_016898 [Solemya velum]